MAQLFTNTSVKRLIIVDDDRDEHFLLRESIGECHFDPEIKTVQDGNQLLSLIKNEPHPDLILLDLNMPKKSGLECLCELRADQESRDLPVVVLSTSTCLSDIEACFEHGASLFFSKPYDFESMKKLIDGIMHIDWPSFKPNLNKAEFVRIAAEGSTMSLMAH
jgi:CheY-like chemotaxis protein